MGRNRAEDIAHHGSIGPKSGREALFDLLGGAFDLWPWHHPKPCPCVDKPFVERDLKAEFGQARKVAGGRQQVSVQHPLARDVIEPYRAPWPRRIAAI